MGTMIGKIKTVFGKLAGGEDGQGLVLVLVFLVLGSLMLTPLLSYMTTGLEASQVYKEGSDELYAADAGVEDALWQIEYGDLETLFTSPAYDTYDYTTPYAYDLSENINRYGVNVTMENIWIPKDITAPGETQARDIIETGKLIVTGSVPSASNYEIKISYYPEAGENLAVETVGIWLPPGFDYVTGSSNLEADVMDPFYPSSVNNSNHAGGKAVVWTFSSVDFEDFPGVVPGNIPLISTITFQFTSSKAGSTPAALAWMTTSGVSDIPFSWDADTKVFKIVSVAGDTEIEAYSLKSELRELGSAISGDYFAFGNTLLTPTGDVNYRNRLYDASSTTVAEGDLPSTATIKAAYLYWSGWIDWNGFEPSGTTTIFSDDCSDFSNWDRGSGNGDETRVPTGDGDVSGTWNYSPCWDDVDETTPDDGNYMTGTTNSGGYKLFTFSPFSIPTGSSISDLTVYVRARDTSWGSGNIRPSIKVNGTLYNTTAPSNYTESSFTTYSYSYNVNPNTGLAWVAEDINGTGSNPLQQFGVYSTDMDPDVQVSMVYAAVNYGDSRWSVVSGEFQGHGSGSATTEQRTITLESSLDLSSYTPGTVMLSWDQSKGGTLESADTLYYAFYDGSSWSTDYVAFSGDSPASSFSTAIPSAYMTSDFKMRLYFNFDDTDEYVYLDNINIERQVSLQYPDNPTTDSLRVLVENTARVNKVLLNGNQVTAEEWHVMETENPPGYSMFDGQWSYSCYYDATDLVLQLIEDEELESNGVGTYTVGHVAAVNADDPDYSYDLYPTGSTGYPLGTPAYKEGYSYPSRHQAAYAGWSLILIYSSPETKGHQLFLYDDLIYAWHVNPDFDDDGTDGGSISGFLAPESVTSEAEAARLTVFCGEGDQGITGDYMQVNGDDLSNTSSPVGNVWNSASPGLTVPGVDIDTFTIQYPTIAPGDTQASVDLPTDSDGILVVYIILSFRSDITSGGTVTYLIRG